jgi:hypothetical protein
MLGIVGIGFSVICQDSKVAGFCDAKPCSLLLALKVSRGEDALVM